MSRGLRHQASDPFIAELLLLLQRHNSIDVIRGIEDINHLPCGHSHNHFVGFNAMSHVEGHAGRINIVVEDRIWQKRHKDQVSYNKQYQSAVARRRNMNPISH